jgi:uncharacterized membrane protein
MHRNTKSLRNAGILLGVGMGGFVDGIVFHQILQLHNMLSNRYFPDTLANEQLNMVWDGVFHIFTWVMTAIGLSLLWKTAKYGRSPLNTKVFTGGLWLGWGLFNLIEGLIDHQIIGLHHVVERARGGEQLFYDLLFLASGALMIALGVWLIRRGKAEIKTELANVSRFRGPRAAS